LIPQNHAVNSLFNSQHTKNITLHKFLLKNLIKKQKEKLKSPIVDTNDHLSEILDSFTPFHFIFSPGLRLVNHFLKNITFHSPASSDNKDIAKHIDNLNNAFHQSQIYPHATAIITDGSVVTLLENFLWKYSMGYILYPWISLLEPTLETSYKLQT